MMSKSLSEKYDEGVYERLRAVEFRSLENERAVEQLQKDVGKLQEQGRPREQVGKLRHRVEKLEQQIPDIGNLIDDSNEYTLCILFRHVINQEIEPGLRARLIVEQTEDGAGRIFLDHIKVEEKEDTA